MSPSIAADDAGPHAQRPPAAGAGHRASNGHGHPYRAGLRRGKRVSPQPWTVSTARWRGEPEAIGKPFEGRTAILSPFDRLTHDRGRALELFDFEYTLEMYKPKEQRRWGSSRSPSCTTTAGGQGGHHGGPQDLDPPGARHPPGRAVHEADQERCACGAGIAGGLDRSRVGAPAPKHALTSEWPEGGPGLDTPMAMRILLHISTKPHGSYDVHVPNKTIYVSDGDLRVFQRAQELAGDNLSAAISAALRRYVDVEEGRQEGFDEITVRVRPKPGRKVRFIGVLLGEWTDTSPSRSIPSVSIGGETGEPLLHVEHSPDFTLVDKDGKPAGWRANLGLRLERQLRVDTRATQRSMSWRRSTSSASGSRPSSSTWSPARHSNRSSKTSTSERRGGSPIRQGGAA